MRPVQAKVIAIEQYPTPTTKKELMRFLGLVGYYCCSCRNFSTVVAPLTNLLKAKVRFVWSAPCQQAFEHVKAVLCSPPVLAAPRLDQPFELQADASDVGAGAVLLQRDGNRVEHSMSFFSRKFNRPSVKLLHYKKGNSRPCVGPTTLWQMRCLEHLALDVSVFFLVCHLSPPVTPKSLLQAPGLLGAGWRVTGCSGVITELLSMAL